MRNTPSALVALVAAISIAMPDGGPVDDEARTSTSDETLVRLCGAILAVLVAYTCALAEAVIVPILIAILLGLIFAPMVRGLERWRIPRPLGALAAVTVAMAILAGAFLALAAPARAWIARMPRALPRRRVHRRACSAVASLHSGASSRRFRWWGPIVRAGCATPQAERNAQQEQADIRQRARDAHGAPARFGRPSPG